MPPTMTDDEAAARRVKDNEDIYRAVFMDWLVSRHPAAWAAAKLAKRFAPQTTKRTDSSRRGT